MFTKKQLILIKGSLAICKLMNGIEKSILEGDYAKVLGENPPESLKRAFAFKAKTGMTNIQITVYRKTLLFGFFTFQMEDNFLTKEEASHIKRLCLLNQLIVSGEEEKKAMEKALKKFPLKLG